MIISIFIWGYPD